ncbi:zinc finger protein 384 isoform X6 [Oncorhynchus kisutch]|uniref:zinc finger protein 384 isoform X6 n=1 Tax=Oncorhynchus kisutch TaxID=8019 RepID=UPI0012DE15B6|nr:zinc finger protein 384 isoform X6 [Oncorhynchus kisutch]
MEDSHFNSSYFWSPVPTVQGQIENAMFLNKMKEQLSPDNKGSPSFPHSSHYPTAVLTMDAGGRVVPKQEGGGVQLNAIGGHLHQPHTSQNITVVPVQSAGIMTAGKKEDLVIPPAVMPTPGKRGRKKKSMMPRAGATLPPGSDALILAHLAAGGQHHTADHYDLSNDEDDHGNKDGTKSYRCRMCAVTFFSKSDMQIHAKSHTEAKPHKCPHCSKSFANSSYLSQHIRIHSGAKPYTCSYCQKTFRQLSHLQQHTRIHTGDRPYKCIHPGCEKAFTQLSNLQSHRRQHNKDKPYKCHNCNRGYTDAASLEVHLTTHTVKHAKLYSCGLCNRAYTSETYLMKHMRKHNPDPLTVAAAIAAQQAQGHTPGGGGRGRGRGRGGGGANSVGGPGGAGQNPGQNQSQNPNNPQQGSYPQTEGVPCSFDLHQYKTVSAGEIQYKPVSVADLSAHKDLCLTVSTSAIQVEHMNS